MENITETFGRSAERTAIVLQGGGARGAYQVGVLKAIAEITGARRTPFPVICGSSVGAINAASLAVMSGNFQQATKHLELLWRGLRCQSIYETGALPLLLNTSRWAGTLMFGFLGFRSDSGLLDCSPLRDLLEREFNRVHLHRAIRNRWLHALCITASSYSQGAAVTFFEGASEIAEWQRSRRFGLRTSIGPEHLLASSALPIAFAPVGIDGEFYGDGALRSTSPLSPAIRTGASRILVVGTRDVLAEQPQLPRPNRSPNIGEVAGHALDILFNDNIEADYERMLRINETVSLLSPDAQTRTPLRKITSLLMTPSRDLRDVAKEFADDLPRAVRLLMVSTGAWRGDGRLESYLMFEPAYVGALIDLGYSDTMARSTELLNFFGFDQAASRHVHHG